jgi:hypothetical protein
MVDSCTIVLVVASPLVHTDFPIGIVPSPVGKYSTGGQTLNFVSVNYIEKKYGRIKGNDVR